MAALPFPTAPGLLGHALTLFLYFFLTNSHFLKLWPNLECQVSFALVRKSPEKPVIKEKNSSSQPGLKVSHSLEIV